MKMKRPWDTLPTLALVNIFRRISIKDRICHVPLVCSSWAHASRDPDCWTSMVPHSDLDFAFLKDSKPYSVVSVDVYGDRATIHRPGLLRLETLIRRADDRGGITSIFLFPFLTPPALTASPNHDALLHLISLSCPNLKYLSLYGTSLSTEESILEVICSCKKLEVVDFADTPYFSPLILEEMGKSCPNIRGIRRNGSIDKSDISALAQSFGRRLKLLNMSNSPILHHNLIAIVNGCVELKYLDVRGCRTFMPDVLGVVRAEEQIDEFFYDYYLCCYRDRIPGGYGSEGDGSKNSSKHLDDTVDDDDLWDADYLVLTDEDFKDEEDDEYEKMVLEDDNGDGHINGIDDDDGHSDSIDDDGDDDDDDDSD